MQIKLSVIARCLIFLCSGFYYTSAYAQADSLLVKKADSLAAAGRQDEAVALYSKLLKQNPKNEKALRGRGFVYMQQQKLKLSEADLKAALLLNPRCSNCYVNLALVHYSMHDSAGAFKAMNDAVKTDDKNTYAYLSRGQLYLYAGNTDAAMNDLNRVLSIDSTNSDAYYNRASVYIELKQEESAFADLCSAIRLAPRFAKAWFSRGIYYANRQQWDDALYNFNKAAVMDSTNSSYFTNIANVYLYKNDPSGAKKYYSKALALDKNNYEALYYRATASYRLEDMDASCEDLRLLISRLPAATADQELLSLKEDVEGQLAEYCDTSSPGYYYQRGVAAYNLQQFEKAVAWYDKGMTKFPGSYMMNDFKGNALLALGRNEEAETAYTKALSLQRGLEQEVKNSRSYKNENAAAQSLFVVSTVAFTYSARAEARANLGNSRQALEDAESAVKLVSDKTPSAENIYNTRGIVYLGMNDNSNALSSFNKAIQINPSFSSAYINRAIVKINLAYKTKIATRFVSISSRNINASFDLPSLKKETINRGNLEAALSDCNKAIQLEQDKANAWYIRAIIKILLGESDFCYDLLKAQQLGAAGAAALIAENNCR